MDSRVGGVHFFFVCDFEFYVAVLGIGNGPNEFRALSRFKILDAQPETLNMGPVPTNVHEMCAFQKSCHGFLTWYLLAFRPGCFQIRIFVVFGRNQTDARRKAKQIRSGIT